MNRVVRLRIDAKRRVLFIFGITSTMVAFKDKLYSPRYKMTYENALEFYNEFLRLGAERIL